MKAHSHEQLEGFRVRITERLAELGSGHSFPAAEVFKLIDDL